MQWKFPFGRSNRDETIGRRALPTDHIAENVGLMLPINIKSVVIRRDSFGRYVLPFCNGHKHDQGACQVNVIQKALQHEIVTVSSDARMNLPHEGSLDARVGASGTTM